MILSVDEIREFVWHPEDIETWDQADAVLEWLEATVLDVSAQIEAHLAQIAAGMSVEETGADPDWLRRATKAKLGYQIAKNRTIKRRKQILGITGVAETPRKDPAVELAKQARLQEEAALRREALALTTQQVVLAQAQAAADREAASA